jgi:hypothetical protein
MMSLTNFISKSMVLYKLSITKEKQNSKRSNSSSSSSENEEKKHLTKEQNIHYKNDEDVKRGTKDDISGAMYTKKEMMTSLDMRDNQHIQKNISNGRDVSQGRPSVNEDVLKGLRLSGNDTNMPKKNLAPPQQHLMHKNTLMGDVRISDRNLNDSEIKDLEKELSKIPGSGKIVK